MPGDPAQLVFWRDEEESVFPLLSDTRDDWNINGPGRAERSHARASACIPTCSLERMNANTVIFFVVFLFLLLAAETSFAGGRTRNSECIGSVKIHNEGRTKIVSPRLQRALFHHLFVYLTPPPSSRAALYTELPSAPPASITLPLAPPYLPLPLVPARRRCLETWGGGGVQKRRCHDGRDETSGDERVKPSKEQTGTSRTNDGENKRPR